MIIDTGCWKWISTVNDKGYGVFTPKTNQSIAAHRYSYQIFKGIIPAGLIIDHLCRNPGCVNPEHLEVVTYRENEMRGINPQLVRLRQLSKTHCPHGHPYDSNNTRYYKGRRFCRECNRIKNKRQRNAKQEALKRAVGF